MMISSLSKTLKDKTGKTGETLVETLVALTIAGLAMIMLAMAIGVGSNIVSQSRTVESNYYNTTDALAERPSSGAASGKVSVTDGDSNTVDINVSYISSDTAGEDGETNLPGGVEGVTYWANELKG